LFSGIILALWGRAASPDQPDLPDRAEVVLKESVQKTVDDFLKKKIPSGVVLVAKTVKALSTDGRESKPV
jgi:hypothetical protein